MRYISVIECGCSNSNKNFAFFEIRQCPFFQCSIVVQRFPLRRSLLYRKCPCKFGQFGRRHDSINESSVRPQLPVRIPAEERPVKIRLHR
jgi:hypothetical protein